MFRSMLLESNDRDRRWALATMSNISHSTGCLIDNLRAQIIERARHTPGVRPFRIAIAGDGGIGKSTLAKNLSQLLEAAVIVEADGYILPRNEREAIGKIVGEDDRSFDMQDFERDLKEICISKYGIRLKKYSHHTGRPYIEGEVSTARVSYFIFDGSYLFTDEMAHYYDFCVLLDANRNTRRALRKDADLKRGYSPTQFLDNWPTYDALYLKYSDQLRINANVIVGVTNRRRFVLDDPSYVCRCNSADAE